MFLLRADQPLIVTVKLRILQHPGSMNGAFPACLLHNKSSNPAYILTKARDCFVSLYLVGNAQQV